MEGGLSDRALKVLRAVLHEKANVDLAEMPDPALVADQISLFELTCERACGPVTLAEIRNWIQQHGYELKGVCCRRTISVTGGHRLIQEFDADFIIALPDHPALPTELRPSCQMQRDCIRSLPRDRRSEITWRRLPRRGFCAALPVRSDFRSEIDDAAAEHGASESEANRQRNSPSTARLGHAMTFRSGTRSVCSPASRGTRGAAVGPFQAVPLKSCRKEKALDLRPWSGAAM